MGRKKAAQPKPAALRCGYVTSPVVIAVPAQNNDVSGFPRGPRYGRFGRRGVLEVRKEADRAQIGPRGKPVAYSKPSVPLDLMIF